jgi:hypothetical protein
MAEGGLHPKQLDVVEAEAQSLRKHKTFIDTPLSGSEDLMDFATEAFNQNFRTHLNVGIDSFSQSDKEEVLYVAGTDPDEDLPIYNLVRLYVDFCNRWPDVLNISYGGSPADFREFRAELMPRLLATLLEVAKEHGDDPEESARIDRAKSDYEEALKEARSAERSER